MKFDVDESAPATDRTVHAKISEILDGRGEVTEHITFVKRKSNTFKKVFIETLSKFIDDDCRKKVQSRCYDTEIEKWIR